jgi:hypothetical protein
MDGHSILGAGSASLSPTSPVSVRHGPAPTIKRKRSTGGLDAMDSSPGSGIGGDEDQSLLDREKKRQPGVKRACNECRQQKVSHAFANSFSQCLVAQHPGPIHAGVAAAAPRHSPRHACLNWDSYRLTCDAFLAIVSCGAMWYKIPSRAARGVIA